MQARDTSEKAAAIQAALNRALAPERRFLQALEISEFSLQLARAGMRRDHPELDEAQLSRALAARIHADVLSRRK